MTLVACGGGSVSTDSSGLAIPPHNIVSTVDDATGDATASAGVAWDISRVQTTLVEGPFKDEYLTLQVAVSFTQDVSTALPNPGQPLRGYPDRLGVQILLNIDGSANTGSPGYACSQSATVPGVDAVVDAGGYAGRHADGSYTILDSKGVAHDVAPVSVSGHVITYTIGLAAWGAPATGIQKTKISVIAFNGSGQDGVATDCAPDAGPMSVSGT
jgi:hypothetical protein